MRSYRKKVVIFLLMVRNPTKAPYGGIFRDCNNVCNGFFSQNIITYSTFIAQITGTIKAIEIAAEKNWNNLWLETDSQLVLLDSKSQNMVP
jgi:ribonuclease HI